MDWLTFISQMTQALAWPVSLAVVLLLYRDSLLKLATRLINVKMGDFEATFSSEARQVEEIIAEAKKGLPAPPVVENTELFELARTSPSGAILEAWLRIERKLIELASSVGQDASRMPTLRLISLLAEKQVINGYVADSLRGLTAMRNLAVHAVETEVTTAKAVEFVALAGTIEILLSTPGLRTAKQPRASAA
jgi:hypothetical protein